MQHSPGRSQHHHHPNIQFDNSDANYFIQQLKQELANAKNKISNYEHNNKHNSNVEEVSLFFQNFFNLNLNNTFTNKFSRYKYK